MFSHAIRAGLLFAACIAALLAVLALLHSIGIESHLERLFDWIGALGWRGLLLYLVIQIFAVILLLPGIAFTLGAGILFGPVKGSLVILVGTTLGACVAFSIARRCFGDKARRWLQRYRTAGALAASIEADSWRLVMLTRLIPLFPFKISNYAFGLSPLRLPYFALGTLIGIVPLSITNVCAGAYAGNLLEAFATQRELNTLDFVWLGCGLIAAVIVIAVISQRAAAALKSHDQAAGPAVDELQRTPESRPPS